MHKVIPILFALSLITAGCISSAGTGTATTAPTATPQVTATAAPVTFTATSAQVTTIRTTVVTTPATTAPGKPLAAPVTLKGIGSGFAEFQTVAPGKISILWAYDSSLGNLQFCKEGTRKAHLSGASFDADVIGYHEKEIFNLITPGDYKIQVSGACYGWKFTIANAV